MTGRGTGTPTVERPSLDSLPLAQPWDRRRISLVIALGVMVVAFGISLPVVDFSLGNLLSGVDKAWNLLQRMVPIQFSNFPEIVRASLETVFMAVIGTLVAVVLSLPLAFLSARNTAPGRLWEGPAKGLIVAARTIPDLVFAAIFVRMFGIGVLPGVLALGLHSIGMLGKLFGQAIEEIDEGPRDAVVSTGASRQQVAISAILPQILPAVIGLSLYRLDINLRISAVLGFVGAGGIGTLLRTALGNLRYDQALGIIVVVAVLVILVEALSVGIRRSILGREAGDDSDMQLGLATKRSVLARMGGAPKTRVDIIDFDRDKLTPPLTPERRRKLGFGVLVVALIVVSFVLIRLNPLEIVAAVPQIFAILGRFVPPDFVTNPSGMWQGLAETIAIGIVASVIGVAVSIPVGFLMAENVTPARWLYVATRYLIVVYRSVPELIIAVLFVAAVGLGPFAGTLALAVGTAGFAAKLFADSLEEIDPGPREAVTATGASSWQERMAAVVPQALPMFVGTSLYVLDINIRAATVLGIVGAGGIGFILIQSIRTLDFARVTAVMIMIFVVVYAIERFAGYVRAKLI